MNFRGSHRDDPEINLIPMIDVLLVIIIFLMLTTTYSRFAELQINLPSAQAEKLPERANEINIVMTTGGEYLVNRRTVVFRDVASFRDELRRTGENMKDPVIVINADSNVTHQ